VPVRSRTARTRHHIDELFAQEAAPGDLGEVALFAAALPLQAALEAEITEFLGRDRDRRILRRLPLILVNQVTPCEMDTLLI
jgi:putative transposase